MDIQIDQSGKIEDTGQPTAIAFANGTTRAIVLPAHEKRILQQLFRQAGKRRVFIYRVFALLVFLLIEDYLDQLESITIDTEYPGKENLIKQYLLNEIRKKKSFSAKDIHFQQIGKKSKAHDTAWKTYKDYKQPSKTISAANIQQIIF